VRHTLDILHEDDAVVVINKRAGVSSTHDPARPDEATAESLLQAVYGDILLVHRLDRDTSGVLLVARTAAAHAALSAQFETRAVAKTYHAIVVGLPRWDERTIDAPLRVDGDRKHRTVVDARDGKPSVTHARVVQRLKGYSLVEADPHTGRTHQIRAHLGSVGAPVACDALYGDGQPVLLSRIKRGYRPNMTLDHIERPLLGRLGLHALRLEFAHPSTGEAVTVEAPLAKDFGATLKQLGRL
jgi:RluA family pseudouridine synthase